MSAKPATSQKDQQTTTTQERRSWIDRIVGQVKRRLRTKPTKQLEQLAAAPALAVVSQPQPKAKTARRSTTVTTPPKRPIEGASRPLMRLAIVNHKGGVGKTSTAINLAAALAEMDYRVLIVDCDSQGDLSAVYAPGSDQQALSIANLFDGTASVEQLIRATAYTNLSIIPADERLNIVDRTHGFAADPNATCLANAVAALQNQYDYVLFDCPPRPHLSAFAALCAATHVVIPCEPSQFSVRSMVRLMEEIDLARRTFNPQLQLLGYFLSKVAPRSATQASYRQMLIEAFGATLVLKTAIPVLATYEAAVNVRKPVVAYRPKSLASSIVRQFALELIGVPHAIPH